VPGVRAIVLGGSRARGTATPDSDYDIGLYYEPEVPIDTKALGQVTSILDDAGAIVTELGFWGPWINGGGWLIMGGRRVDLLYRDLGRVRAVAEDCRAGRIETHYQPGHPHGFVSASYLGEVATCHMLRDLHGVLAPIKQAATPYPAALAAAMIRSFAWEVDFALEIAQKAVPKRDVNYIAGCAFRAVACLCQVLFALNGEYLLNEKGAVALADGFACRPEYFAERVQAAYAALGEGRFEDGLGELRSLARETEALMASQFPG
jgi:hypothetical protein